jgi:putative transposase
MDRTDCEAIQIHHDNVLSSAIGANVFLNSVSNYSCDRSWETAMKRLQAFRFELRPNGEQVRSMRRFAGACRFVYNKALELQHSRFAAGERHLSYAGLCAELTQWKGQPETNWPQDTHSQVLQQSLKNLDRAYANCFSGRAAPPRFKKRGRHDSFRYPQGFKLEQHNDRT